MTYSRWDLLDSLRTLGPSTARELAEDLGRSHGVVLGQLRSLEAGGYCVQRGTRPVYRQVPALVWEVVPERVPATWGGQP